MNRLVDIMTVPFLALVILNRLGIMNGITVREVIRIIPLIVISLITITILDSEFQCYKYTAEDYASLLGNHDYQTNRVKVKLSG